jgi:hypothetical protein
MVCCHNYKGELLIPFTVRTSGSGGKMEYGAICSPDNQWTAFNPFRTKTSQLLVSMCFSSPSPFFLIALNKLLYHFFLSNAVPRVQFLAFFACSRRVLQLCQISSHLSSSYARKLALDPSRYVCHISCNYLWEKGNNTISRLLFWAQSLLRKYPILRRAGYAPFYRLTRRRGSQHKTRSLSICRI